MSAPARQRVGKYRLLNQADVAALSAYPDPDHPDDPGARVVDCYYCGTTLRPRRATGVRRFGDPIPALVTDHFLHDCPAVEVTR